MPRAFLVTLILFVPAHLVRGQAAEPPAPIFPSDGKRPAEADGAELLQAICPGQVEVGAEFGCGKQCPYFTDFGRFGDGLPWSLSVVTRGHFLSPTSDDAVLAVEGCESHMENFGGTVLLTRSFRGWVMDWYKAGIVTSQCHKVPLQDGREILVCMGRAGAQGNNESELYVEDLLSPAATLMGEDETPFFAAPDNSLTCGYNDEDPRQTFPVTRSFIEKVQFPLGPSGSMSTISVTASFGRALTTSEAAQACIRAADKITLFSPAVKSYHLDFVFDGHDYKPTAASVEAARMFGSR